MYNLTQMINQFQRRVFPVALTVRDLPFCLVFKTTNYCWYSCRHCCESSGPNQPRTFIPADVVGAYMDAATQLPNFDKNVVFTGGEIMSAYRFGPANYVPQLLDNALGHQMGVDIKTNGAWAGAAFGQKIFDDLAGVVARHAPYSLSISLSLDDYHISSVTNVAKIIQEMAHRPNQHVYIHLSGFDATFNPLMTQLMARLRRANIHPEQGMIVHGNQTMPILCVGDKLRIYSSTATLFAHGRGADLPAAKPVENSRFQILSPDRSVLMAFDPAGRVTLGENSGPKISAPWRVGKNIRGLDAIRTDLVMNAACNELAAWIMGTHPLGR